MSDSILSDTRCYHGNPDNLCPFCGEKRLEEEVATLRAERDRYRKALDAADALLDALSDDMAADMDEMYPDESSRLGLARKALEGRE